MAHMAQTSTSDLKGTRNVFFGGPNDEAADMAKDCCQSPRNQQQDPLNGPLNLSIYCNSSSNLLRGPLIRSY